MTVADDSWNSLSFLAPILASIGSFIYTAFAVIVTGLVWLFFISAGLIVAIIILSVIGFMIVSMIFGTYKPSRGLREAVDEERGEAREDGGDEEVKDDESNEESERWTDADGSECRESN